MSKRGRLSRNEEAEIVAKCAAGASYDSVAKEYGVVKSTIWRVVNSSPDFSKKCKEKKKAAEETAAKNMEEWVKSKHHTVQALMDTIIESLKTVDFTEESVRDRVGAVKILREVFVPHVQEEENADEALNKVVEAIKEVK